MSLKTLFAGTILVYSMACCVLGQGAGRALQNQLIDRDREIWEAMSHAPAGLDELEKALAPDYLDIDSGSQNSREEVLRYIRGLTKFSFRYENARACVLSPTSGYVIAELSYSSVQNGSAASGKVLTTTVYSKERGRWVARLHTEMDMKPQTR